MLQNIFEPFIQGPRSADRSECGLGIGLALVKNLVAMQDGRVERESDGPGHGSTFTIRLPLANARQPGARSVTTNSSLPPATQTRCILVVDDKVDAGELLTDALRHAGHDVSFADSADGALARRCPARTCA